ncbi:MAG: hypothetical protein JNK85_04885 [Verrucomicrobiales bacterium]|nr:hypothetical protein [Verrucomicrobiales bacterium]
MVNGDSAAAGFSGTDRGRFAAVVETLRPSGVTAEIAAAQFAEAHAIIGGRAIIDAAREFASRHRLDLPPVTVADAVAAFISDRVKSGASTRYVGDLRSRLLHGFAASNAVTLGDLHRTGSAPGLKPNRAMWAMPVSGNVFGMRIRSCHRVSGEPGLALERLGIAELEFLGHRVVVHRSILRHVASHWILRSADHRIIRFEMIPFEAALRMKERYASAKPTAPDERACWFG